MSELIDRLRDDFQDPEYRHSYAEECLNTMIATQIRVLREQRGLSQGGLGNASGMAQPRITLLEDANYAKWSINTLKRIARAFDVALTVRFDAFSDVVLDFESLGREQLERPSFKDDPLFQYENVRTSGRFKRARATSSEAQRSALEGNQMTGQDYLFPIPAPFPFESPAARATTNNTLNEPAAEIERTAKASGETAKLGGEQNAITRSVAS